MLLNDDLNKLIDYAKALGVTVIFKKGKRGDPGAYWHSNAKEIVLYTWARQRINRLVLSLLHELGHHLDHLAKGRIIDPKLDEALLLDDAKKPISKKQRYLIYKSEKDGSRYRFTILKELKLILPKWELKVDILTDIWEYNQYYLTGLLPTRQEANQKQKELTKIYKKHPRFASKRKHETKRNKQSSSS